MIKYMYWLLTTVRTSLNEKEQAGLNKPFVKEKSR
jgi:hypothetical protein